MRVVYFEISVIRYKHPKYGVIDIKFWLHVVGAEDLGFETLDSIQRKKNKCARAQEKQMCQDGEDEK
jgi:hypothetical protein